MAKHHSFIIRKHRAYERSNIYKFDCKLSKQYISNEFCFGYTLSSRTICIFERSYYKQEEVKHQELCTLPPEEAEKGGKWDTLGALLVNMEATMPSSCALWCGLTSAPRQPGTAACGDRQLCQLPLAPQAKLQAEAGVVGFLSICQPTALQGHCEGDAGQVLHEKSSPSCPPQFWGWTDRALYLI